MYRSIKNDHFFVLHINNKLFAFPKVEEFFKIKTLIKRNKPNTIKTIVSVIQSFLYWCMANDNKEDEDLAYYLSRYMQDCENGFEILDNIFIKELNQNIKYTVLRSIPKKQSTIEKNRAILEDFFNTTNQKLFEKFELKKNVRSLKYSSKNSIHDGYGLKMGSLAQNAFLKNEPLIKPRNNSFKNDFRAFPYKLFNGLLDISSPREKMIYILCGACSARISQALNLTVYDLNFDSKDVWLIDPRSDDQLGFHGFGRKSFLRDVYKIDCSKDKPHIHIGFKASIPLRFRSRTPLYWLSNVYKFMFFDALSRYNYIPENLRSPKHPFIFVTKTGARLTPQQAAFKFNNDCKKLAKKFPEYSIFLHGLGLHSLRHMFGVAMATFQAYVLMQKGDKNNQAISEQIKLMTKEAMGHRSMVSTDVYFNRPWHIDVQLGEYFKSMYDEKMKIETGDEYDYKKRFTKPK